MPVMTKAISAFPDGKILHVSFDTSSKPYVNYFDIFDQKGNWLLGFNTNQYLTGWQGRNVEIDRDGNLIIESWVPFPQVIKYGFRIERRAIRSSYQYYASKKGGLREKETSHLPDSCFHCCHSHMRIIRAGGVGRGMPP